MSQAPPWRPRTGTGVIAACLGRAGRVCGHCGRSVLKGRPCKRRTCPSYSRLWAYDWRIVLLENLIAYGGKATMYTLTPPGADQLPWDRAKCGHAEGVACSGPRGCVIEAESRLPWNESFQRRLSRIYETAQAPTKREVGCRANVLAIGKEAQRRGATHAHFVVGCETGLELRASRAFRPHLERLSGRSRYEFGHVNGKFVKPKPAREIAAYLSSYLSLAGEARHRSPRRCITPSFRGFPSTCQDGSHKPPGRQCETSADNGICGSALGKQDRSRRGGVTNERGWMSWLLPCRWLIGLNAATSSVAYSSTNPELRRAYRRGAARGRRGSAVLTIATPWQAGLTKASPAPFASPSQ